MRYAASAAKYDAAAYGALSAPLRVMRAACAQQPPARRC